MKRKILLSLIIIALIVMAVLSQTKPDRAEHYDAVKKMALKTVDHELTSNPLTAEYAALGTVAAMNLVDEYMQRNLFLNDHTFYNVGMLVYNDRFIPVSIGIFGKIYLIVDENDIKRVVEIPEIKQMMDLKNLLKK